jgi:hypothetical protein
MPAAWGATFGEMDDSLTAAIEAVTDPANLTSSFPDTLGRRVVDQEKARDALEELGLGTVALGELCREAVVAIEGELVPGRRSRSIPRGPDTPEAWMVPKDRIRGPAPT